MKLGLTIEPYQGIPADMLIPFAHAINLDHIEINERIIPDATGVAAKIGKLTTTFHLPIVWIEKYDLGVKKKEKAIQKVISFINKWKEQLNIIYTLSHPPEGPDSSFEYLMEKLQEIETPIVLENIPNQKDEDFLSFYLKAKQILGNQLAGHAMDAPHRFITEGDNWLNPPKELLQELVYVHITDCTREFDSHLPLGQGEMPFNEFFTLLKSIDYQGIINQEIKPKGLDLESIMDSSLLCVKPFSKVRYLQLKIKYSFLRPILRRKITTMANQKKK